MPKLNNSKLKKIDLEDIVLKDNVRKQYNDISELAGSIERDGQIQPVAVSKNDDGTYNLIAGYRRFHAHKHLVEQGKPFNQIEAIIKNGNFEILQLIENIQREDLNPVELEAGLRKMVDSGLSQKDIATRLNKSPQWVSGGLKAEQTRVFLESSGVDTSGLSSSVVEKIGRVPEENKIKIAKAVKNNGGTVKAVKDVIADREIKDIDPFKGFKREIAKLKKDYDLHFIVNVLKEIY